MSLRRSLAAACAALVLSFSPLGTSIGSAQPIAAPDKPDWYPWPMAIKGAYLPESYMVQAGQQDGEKFFVCRALHDGGLFPGKLVDGKCHIGVHGTEDAASHYHVLVSPEGAVRWASREQGGRLPDAVWPGGADADGERLNICRAEHNGGLHPGKLRNGVCSIAAGGQVIRTTNFEVLMFDGGRQRRS